jgi:hypothetical protein
MVQFYKTKYIIICAQLLFTSNLFAQDRESKEDIQPPKFSHQRGFYPYTFQLKLSHPDPGVTIHYTIDGSEPSLKRPFSQKYHYKNNYQRRPQSPDGKLLHAYKNTLIYNKPIKLGRTFYNYGHYSQISTHYLEAPQPHLLPENGNMFIDKPKRIWNEFSEISKISFNKLIGHENLHIEHPRAPAGMVDKAIVVRAIAINSKGQASTTVTNTYFFGNPRRFNLPILAVNLDPRDLFDYDQGIFVAGRKFDAWRAKNRDVTATMGVADANWRTTGKESERIATIEYFDTDATSVVLNQTVGLRVHGAFSRAVANKSFRIYSRKKYGADNINMFGKFDRRAYPSNLILRNSGNDRANTLFRDAFLHKAFEGLNVETSKSKPTIVFINGEYWGIYNIRERLDEEHFAKLINVKPNEISTLKNFQIDGASGMASDWSLIVDELRASSKSKQASLKIAEKYIDIDNMIDAHIAYIYSANIDWPHNNSLVWRRRFNSASNPGNSFQYSKWRWAIQDFDLAFHSYQHPTLKYALSVNGPKNRPDLSWSTELFRLLMSDDAYRNKFISRYYDLLNLYLSPERIDGDIKLYSQSIASEIPHHINRWATHKNTDDWTSQVKKLTTFSQQRQSHQFNELESIFGLKPVKLTINNPSENAESININGFVIKVAPNSSISFRYYKGSKVLVTSDKNLRLPSYSKNLNLFEDLTIKL